VLHRATRPLPRGKTMARVIKLRIKLTSTDMPNVNHFKIQTNGANRAVFPENEINYWWHFMSTPIIAEYRIWIVLWKLYAIKIASAQGIRHWCYSTPLWPYG
jgi:hypothetical protein